MKNRTKQTIAMILTIIMTVQASLMSPLTAGAAFADDTAPVARDAEAAVTADAETAVTTDAETTVTADAEAAVTADAEAAAEPAVSVEAPEAPAAEAAEPAVSAEAGIPAESAEETVSVEVTAEEAESVETEQAAGADEAAQLSETAEETAEAVGTAGDEEAAESEEVLEEEAEITAEAARKVVFTGSANGVNVTVTDEDGAFPEGTKMVVTAVPAAAVFETVEKAVDGELNAVKAVDITFYNKEGKEIEPEGNVTVSMTAEGFNKDNTQRIVHIDDNNRAEVMAVTDMNVTDAANSAVVSAEFETGAFSIYVITDEEGNVVIPRASYRFCDEDGKTLTGISEQTIKNGESLRRVSAPAYDNKAFLGWFIYNGSWGEEISFETPVQVLFGNEAAVYGNSVVVPENEDHIDVTVRARYTTNFGMLYFLMPSNSSISYTDTSIVKTTIKVGVREGETTAEYRIPDVTELSVQSANVSYEFVGWSDSAPKKSGGVYQYYSDSDSRTPISSVAITKSRANVLYPVFKKAHWLTFKTAPAGLNADYVAPAYVPNTSLASTKKPEDPSLRGYRFLYWTTTPTFSEETGKFFEFEKGSEPAAYNFNQYLNENATLYAYWESGYSTYTVIFWKQRATDDKNAAAKDRTYDFAGQETREAKVGQVVNLTEADKNKETDSAYEGFHHKSEQNEAGDKHIDSTNITVASSGASILNVYYDRDLITMRFYGGSGSAPKKGYSDSVWESADSRVTTYTGLYGQSLTDNGYTWPSGSWSYYNDSNGTTGMSYLGSFVLPDGIYDSEGREIRLYANGSGSITIEFYLQNADGTYNTTASDKGYVASAGTFYFSEKYDGFTLDAYSRYTVSKNVRTYYNASGRSQTNGSNAWAPAVEDGTTALSESSFFSSRTYNLEIRYKRRSYAIIYLDGMDGQPLTTHLEGGMTTQKREGVLYGAPVTDYYPAADFEPAVTHTGHSFNGRWYGDRAQTIQVFFHENGDNSLTEEETSLLWYYVDTSGEKIYTNEIPTAAQLAMTLENDGREYREDACTVYTEMPMHDLPVYAGFSKDWYWVKIDPNGGEISESDATYFWEEFGGRVTEYTVTRDYVRSDAGSYYYHYAEFNEADPNGAQPSPRTARYTTDSAESTDGGHTYRRAGADEGYVFAGWYQVNEDGSLTPYNFDTLITGNLILQAQWSERGAYRICYSLESALDRNGNPLPGVAVKAGETAPVDSYKYAENATVVVKSGIVEADNDAYTFAGWYFNNRVLTAGDVFNTDSLLAEKHPGAVGEEIPYDTFVLYPVFVLKDGSDSGADEDNMTRLVLDANGGYAKAGVTVPEGAVLNTDGTQLTMSWMNLRVNEAVTIPSETVFEKANAEFLGWAFSKNAKIPVFKAGQTVGIDNLTGDGYSGDRTNTLYAVWRMTKISVRIRKVDATTAAPLAGASFSLDLNGSSLALTSGEDGYLVNGSEKTISVNAPSEKNYVLTYKLTELLPPDGYDVLKGDVVITVSYDGTVTYIQENGQEQTAAINNGISYVVVTNKKVPAPTGFQNNDRPFGFLFLFGVLLALLMLASLKIRSAGGPRRTR